VTFSGQGIAQKTSSTTYVKDIAAFSRLSLDRLEDPGIARGVLSAQKGDGMRILLIPSFPQILIKRVIYSGVFHMKFQ
jgi:hypothetical protein